MEYAGRNWFDSVRDNVRLLKRVQRKLHLQHQKHEIPVRKRCTAETLVIYCFRNLAAYFKTEKLCFYFFMLCGFNYNDHFYFNEIHLTQEAQIYELTRCQVSSCLILLLGIRRSSCPGETVAWRGKRSEMHRCCRQQVTYLCQPACPARISAASLQTGGDVDQVQSKSAL